MIIEFEDDRDDDRRLMQLIRNIRSEEVGRKKAIKIFMKAERKAANRSRYSKFICRMLDEFKRVGECLQDYGLSKRKLENGEQLPSLIELSCMADSGVDIHYVLTGDRICPLEKPDSLTGEKS